MVLPILPEAVTVVAELPPPNALPRREPAPARAFGRCAGAACPRLMGGGARPQGRHRPTRDQLRKLNRIWIAVLYAAQL